MKEGLATVKHPDPHDWFEVDWDVVRRGTDVVLRTGSVGWLCRRCRAFVTLKSERWNPYYPELNPCQSTEERT